MSTVESAPLISVFLGTKAIMLKLAPVIRELQRRTLRMQLIDTGQHGNTPAMLGEHLEIPPADHVLRRREKAISSLGAGIAWTLSVLGTLALPGRTLRKRYFKGERGYAIVHGDTMSTLLCAALAKRAGQKVVHVEAGLRSHNFLNPFPEELVRVLVTRMADHLFAPSDEAYANLVAMGLEAKSVQSPGNTNLDTLALSRAAPSSAQGDAPYALATLHRMETLYDGRSLKAALDIVLLAHRSAPVTFVTHPATEKRLGASGLLKVLEEAGVKLIPLQPHQVFVRLLENAQFVLTDGGSVQEEVSYLGTPCLLLRKHTERPEGIGRNVVLSDLSIEKADEFLRDLHRLRHEPLGSAVSPSVFIVDTLLTLAADTKIPN